MLKVSLVAVVDMAFCKPLFFSLNSHEVEDILIERIFPAELSPLLVTIGNVLTDYCLKEMTCCMPACFEAVKAHTGQQMDILLSMPLNQNHS